MYKIKYNIKYKYKIQTTTYLCENLLIFFKNLYIV